jgi:hypothetical protein
MAFIYKWDEGVVDIECCISNVAPVSTGYRDAVSESLSAKILGALVDQHSLTDDGGEIRGWLRKVRAGAAV